MINYTSDRTFHFFFFSFFSFFKKSLFDGLEEEDPILTEAFQPRPSAKRLVLRPKSTTNSSIESPNEESGTRNNIIDSNDKTDVSNTLRNNNIEVNDKENQSQDNRFANDRRSSISWQDFMFFKCFNLTSQQVK